jgi:MFS family permease
MFPEPREQAKAIGIYAFVASAGASIGLLAGGVITQGINWHWIFFVNVPIGVVAAILAVRLVADDRGVGLGRGADVVGAVLVTAALMLGVYTIVEVVDHGWGSAHTLGFGGLSVLLLAAFVWRQATAADPLLPLRIFRSRNVTGANLTQFLMVMGMFGMFFSGVLLMQRVLGYDALETGLAFLPVSLGIGLLSLGFSARLNLRFGERAVLLPALALLVVGLGWLTRVPVGASYVVDLLPSMVLIGIGAGLTFPALSTLAMSGATPSDAGLAVLATLSSEETASRLADGSSAPHALTAGYQLAFTVGAVLLVVAVVVAATVLKPPVRQEAVAAEPAYEVG